RWAWGPPPPHRREIRGPGRAADPGPVWASAAGGAAIVSARRTGRGQDLARGAAVLPRFTAGDRERTGPDRALALVTSRALGSDARPVNGPADRGADDRRDAVLRSAALRGGTLHALSVI